MGPIHPVGGSCAGVISMLCRLPFEIPDKVLKLLSAHGASATFMLVGKFADGHEEDLVSMLKEGLA